MVLEKKYWYNTIKHPTDGYHAEFAADPEKTRFRMDCIGSYLTWEELNFFSYFDETLHVISTQLLLQQYTCFLCEAVCQEQQKAPVHQAFFNFQMLPWFYVTHDSSILLLLNSWSKV